MEIPYTSLVEFTVNSLVHRSLNIKGRRGNSPWITPCYDTVEDATGGDSLYDDGYTDDGSVDGYTDDGILDDGSINNIDDGANTDGIDGSVEEAAPQDESAPDSDSEVVQ